MRSLFQYIEQERLPLPQLTPAEEHAVAVLVELRVKPSECVPYLPALLSGNPDAEECVRRLVRLTR